MAEHVHGTMDITAQKKAYAGFQKGVTWGIIATVVVLVVLALVNA